VRCALGRLGFDFQADSQKVYPNLIYFNEAEKGGHFAASEEPELFSGEFRAAFRSLR
jgi:hypothetical protein